MADFTTKLNDRTVTIKDVTDPGYVAPTTGSVIELTDAAARAFIREGELAELRAERDAAVEKRNQLIVDIQVLVDLAQKITDKRLATVAERDVLNERITELNTRIPEIVDWVRGQGDDA